MTRKLFYCLAAVVLLLLGAGCRPSPVAEDWHRFQWALEPSYETHEQAAKALAKLDEKTSPGKKRTRDEVRAAGVWVRDKVVPPYQATVKAAKEAKPQTPEVIAVHEKYVAGLEHMLRGAEILAQNATVKTPAEATRISSDSTREFEKGGAMMKSVGALVDELNQRYGKAGDHP